MHNKAVVKYLHQYAAQEVDLCAAFPSKKSKALVVPLFDESFATWHALLEQIHNQHVLLVAIINAPNLNDDSPAFSAVERTCAMLQELMSVSEVFWQEQHCYGLRYEGTTVLLIDRASESSRRLPMKKGVGLARKIGCDVVASLIVAGIVASHWIRTTDADVVLPTNYFDDEYLSGAATVWPFRHALPEDHRHAEAMSLYEWHLLSYQYGLRWAGSPYAFHTVGSTMCVHMDAYCKVRGFPERAAGEDFYFLNKVRKQGLVAMANAKPIVLSARISTRVPFGTGQAVKERIESSDIMLAPLFYHPGCFIYLKQTLVWISASLSAGRVLENYSTFERGLSESRWWNLIERLNVIALLDGVLRQYQPPQRERAALVAFDAFRTLKLIHAATDMFLPKVDWETFVSESRKLFMEFPAVSSPLGDELSNWRRVVFAKLNDETTCD